MTRNALTAQNNEAWGLGKAFPTTKIPYRTNHFLERSRWAGAKSAVTPTLRAEPGAEDPRRFQEITQRGWRLCTESTHLSIYTLAVYETWAKYIANFTAVKGEKIAQANWGRLFHW